MIVWRRKSGFPSFFSFDMCLVCCIDVRVLAADGLFCQGAVAEMNRRYGVLLCLRLGFHALKLLKKTTQTGQPLTSPLAAALQPYFGPSQRSDPAHVSCRYPVADVREDSPVPVNKWRQRGRGAALRAIHHHEHRGSRCSETHAVRAPDDHECIIDRCSSGRPAAASRSRSSTRVALCAAHVRAQLDRRCMGSADLN